MNIEIDGGRCAGCGKCIDVCPGSLIGRDETGRAVLARSSECWACTACMKECTYGAISYRFGPDLDGRGARLTVRKKGTKMIWTVTDRHGREKKLVVDSQESNAY